MAHFTLNRHCRCLSAGLLLVLAISGCNSDGKQTPTALLERGRMYIDREEYEEAVTALELALQLDPTNASCLFERGYAYEQLDSPAEALADYDTAILIRPEYVAALRRRALLLAKQQDFTAAAESFSRAIKIRPDDARLLRERGQTLYDHGDYDAAAADFARASQLEPFDHEAWFLLGTTELKAQRPGPAAHAFSEAIRRHPQFALGYWHRGEARQLLGFSDKAESDRQRALEIDPDLPAAKSKSPTQQPKDEADKAPKLPIVGTPHDEKSLYKSTGNKQVRHKPVIDDTTLPISTVEPFRVWVDSRGKFSVVAQLVSVNDEIVTLRRQVDGEEIEVPKGRLSSADHAYLAQPVAFTRHPLPSPPPLWRATAIRNQ